MSDNRTGRVREMVAEEVRVLLARRRLSASELARQMGVTQPYISRRLTGDTPFDVDDLERIAEALDVPIAALLPTRTPKGGSLPVVRPTAGIRRTVEARIARTGPRSTTRPPGTSTGRSHSGPPTSGGTARPNRLSQTSSGRDTR